MLKFYFQYNTFSINLFALDIYQLHIFLKNNYCFQNLKQVLINLLPTVFGKQYTPEVQEAWKKMLDLIFLTFAQVYKE